MTAAGIICEYNPFHNGHKYHIEKTRELTNSDCVVALMSGNFAQRGDVTVYDKKIRARAAIENGVDLIIELPAIMSLCSAERFASCGVEILNALGVVSYISFGAETDDMAALLDIAKLLCAEPPEYKSALSRELEKGNSFARSRGIAADSIIPDATEILSSPNNILAIEYIKALIKTNSPVEPVLVKRQGAEHDSENTDGEFISASAIRNLVRESKSFSGFVPDRCIEIYKDAKAHHIKNMESAIIANLLKMSPEEISGIADVSEGLENKIIKAAKDCSDFDTLCESVKSKRYALSRIRRILLHSYLGITKEDLIPPQYIKILDFNEKGQKLLNKAKQEAKLPLVKNFNQIRNLDNPRARRMWERELTFDRIYDLF